MRRKTVALRQGFLSDTVATTKPAILCGPFGWPKVLALLVVTSVLCIAIWWIAMLVCALALAAFTVDRSAAVAVSTLILAGLPAVAYTAVFLRSAWFFHLRLPLRWFASLSSAIVLTLVFDTLSQIAFAFFAGW